MIGSAVANDLQPSTQEARVNRVLLGSGLVAVVLCGATMAAAQAPGISGATSPSRQADDRRTDDSARQTTAARQTEPRQAESPKPAEKKPDPPAKSDPKPSFQRQAEPQRQPEPQRQREAQRQQGHWDDPGPAWRSQGPAWRDLNDRPNLPRPGEDAFRAGQNTSAPRDQTRGRERDSRRNNKNVYIAVPYPVPYEVAPYYPSQLSPEPAPEPSSRVADEPPLGFLQLRVQPRSAEVYVDGALAGTVDDFGGRSARMLPAGPRRVEIVAPGYDTVTFDVRIPENDTVTFTRELEPAVDRPAAAAPAAIPHKALYVVPQCYIGDRMPLPGDMPAGCKVEDVRVIP